MAFNIQRRDGLYSLVRVAKELCRLITAFTPVIQRLYPSNTALLAALTAANVACSALEEAASAQREEGV